MSEVKFFNEVGNFFRKTWDGVKEGFKFSKEGLNAYTFIGGVLPGAAAFVTAVFTVGFPQAVVMGLLYGLVGAGLAALNSLLSGVCLGASKGMTQYLEEN